MKQNYCVITTTAGSREEAEQLAQMLVRGGLAACVQMSPIISVYSWEDALHRDDEWLLLIKTKAALYPQVEKAILEDHSYITPEIICVPVMEGSAGYLAWIDSNTTALN